MTKSGLFGSNRIGFGATRNAYDHDHNQDRRTTGTNLVTTLSPENGSRTHATSLRLPPELWVTIFELLVLKDIQSLLLVHRMIYRCGRPFLFRDIVLCSLDEKRMEKVDLVLREPALATHIRHLHIEPGRWFHQQVGFAKEAQMNLWLSTAPTHTWIQKFKYIRQQGYWRHPMQLYHNLLRSMKSIRISTQLVQIPSLANIQKVTVTFWFPNGQPGPSAEPYYHLWKEISLRTDRLRCLHLKLGPGRALPIFAEALRKSGTKFAVLDTLILRIATWLDSEDNETLEEDIRFIADSTRSTVRSLAASFSDHHISRSEMLFRALGTFPQLSHLDIWSFCPVAEDEFNQFILGHHSTLMNLRLSRFLSLGYPLFLFDIPVSEPNRGKGKFTKLTSVNLWYRIPNHEPLLDQLSPNFVQISNLLTTLVLTCQFKPGLDRGLYLDELTVIVLSLYKSDGGARLKRLKVPLMWLSPEFFDLMGNYLENLEVLDLTYQKVTMFQGSEVEQTGLFWRCMSKRRFPEWYLKSLDINRFVVGGPPEQNLPMMRFLSRRIPTVEEFGPFDWSDTQVDMEIHDPDLGTEGL
ncbi:hypothetical protein BDN72DRAFT_849188 [Pluteus cervinus]|uniref:Uncharacterized protein n=1 Tax=Pluteus cervinus TaxID=181527 RepID=A0ACD3A956_9AGAR|nr:hypothetical protein BDN72DRAFT_849188 [Pluteus cervinus]